MIAILYAKDLIELRQSSEILDKKEAYESLSKTNQYATTYIKPIKMVDSQKIQKIKELINEVTRCSRIYLLMTVQKNSIKKPSKASKTRSLHCSHCKTSTPAIHLRKFWRR